ncbi:MAG: hypothetical protein ABR498_02495 [Candidatus Dormibacteria bacterium]
MNLSLTDLRSLPLRSALLSAAGDVIAATPEWAGDGPGSAAYPVRRNRLVVCMEPAAPKCAELLERLLGELDAAAATTPTQQSLRVRVLAASLRLVAGRNVERTSAGSSRDVLELAAAGITARTSLRATVAASDDVDVRAPEAAALVLVQLAANAERHDGAHEVQLRAAGNAFSVVWHGSAPAGRLGTARRHGDRERWGMGFARIAADAIGAVVHPPHDDGAGVVVATVETGVGRLSLPLAAFRDQRVLRATRAWDEETGALPGTPASAVAHASEALELAGERRGELVCVNGLSARTSGDLTWVAVPPDDMSARARDVIDGLTHERALTEGIAEPRRSRINALAQLLGFVLGSPIQRVPADAWTRRMRELACPFGLSMDIPDFDGIGATDPAVTALLASEAGAAFELADGALWLRVRAGAVRDPVALPLLSNGERRVRLG